jgi:transcription-repair coupling factor (superfamily II helicase)
MALVGLQQISVIATPPARRQPIRTSLDQFDDGRIRTALLREKGRGGQSFVVVPRIEDIAKIAEKLRRIVPELSIAEAHGKMAAADIDAVMVGFAQGKGDVLLATNIIEAGLDVPRANTMIVSRADRFGLAQLHQLRGRVGRGNRRGQVILLTESQEKIAERTMKRLRTLATFDRLGAGFDISARDLDMRGAGDLLGETQAGHMKLIGVDLYQHMLSAALRAARGEDVEQWSPELNLELGGAFPGEWIPEQDVRLTLYLRLSRVEDEAALDAFEDELIDRFGPLPPATQTLLMQARLRRLARAARIVRVDAGPAAIALTPRHDFDVDPTPHGLHRKNDRLLLVEHIADGDRLERVRSLLESLSN